MPSAKVGLNDEAIWTFTPVLIAQTAKRVFIRIVISKTLIRLWLKLTG